MRTSWTILSGCVYHAAQANIKKEEGKSKKEKHEQSQGDKLISRDLDSPPCRMLLSCLRPAAL